MKEEFPFSCLYRASPRWRPLWTSAQVPHSFEIWQTRSLSNCNKRQMDIFICDWWRICSLNQFVTRISCLDSKQLQEFWKLLAERDRTLRLHTQTEGQVNCQKKTKMGKTCAWTNHCTAAVSETLTQASTPDKLQQITCRQAPRHQSLMHDSHWVQCRIPSKISCPHQFDVMNLFPMSRSDVDNLRKDECPQLMEQLGEAQPRRGVLVMELKTVIKDLLLSKKNGQE